MVHRFNLSFENWADFVDFLEEHEDIINEFSDEHDNFAYRIQEHARANEQLPPFFSFTSEQYSELASRDAKALQSLQDDNRVTYEQPDTGEKE